MSHGITYFHYIHSKDNGCPYYTGHMKCTLAYAIPRCWTIWQNVERRIYISILTDARLNRSQHPKFPILIIKFHTAKNPWFLFSTYIHDLFSTKRKGVCCYTWFCCTWHYSRVLLIIERLAITCKCIASRAKCGNKTTGIICHHSQPWKLNYMTSVNWWRLI